MKKLVWTTPAIEDREGVFHYIAEHNPVAALDMDELFRRKSEILKEYPQMGVAGRVEGTREYIVHSSYMLVYEIMDDVVYILGIVHTSRNWPAPA